MEMKLDFGPWESIFYGTVYGHEVEVSTNPDHFFIIMIYDKLEGKRIGAVVEGYKAFLAKGPMEALIETMPRTCFGVEKNFGEKTSKLFFTAFDPFYLDFRQEDYTRKIDNMIRATEENSATIIDLARAAAVELRDLGMSPKTEYAPLLGDPMAILSMAIGRKENPLSKMDLGEKREVLEETAPLIQLGLSKTREIVKESARNIYRSNIIGDSAAQKYASYIIAENMLLENTPVIIIDDENYFSQMGVVSTDPTMLKEELVEFEPMAFPVKALDAKEEIQVSIKDADLIYLLEMMGLKDIEFEKNLSLFGFAAQADTIGELIEKTLGANDLNDYEKLRAERMLKLVEQQMPRMFGGAIPNEELAKTIPGRLGRAVVINTKKLSKEERAVMIHTLFRQLAKAASETKQTNCAFIVPDIDELVRINPERASNAIMRLQNRGIGLIAGSETELPAEISRSASAKISIVTGKDVAVSIKGKRNYRINLRPSLSGAPKI